MKEEEIKSWLGGEFEIILVEVAKNELAIDALKAILPSVFKVGSGILDETPQDTPFGSMHNSRFC